VLLWLVAAASAVALRPLWLALAPHLRPCIFRTLTGLPCPTCGTTRAAVAFLHGDLVSAFVSNPLATLIGILFIAGAPIAALWVVSGRPAIELPQTRSQWLRWILVGVIAVNWLYLIFAS
jgi:hypothetical protein